MLINCPYCRSPVEIVNEPAQQLICPSCGNSCLLPDKLELTETEVERRRRVGKFELLERVGSGGYGVVWKARDTELNRVVAVKIPHVGRLETRGDVERFLREARSSAHLRHPGIVAVHDVGFDGAVPYLVSDFVDGVRLADLLTARRLGFHEAAELVAQVAEALDYAHSMGVVHRDIKPSNIMLEREISASDDKPLPATPGSSIQGRPRLDLAHDSSQDFRVLITDFGLALREGGEVTMTLDGQVLGTPAYMSPEQAAGLSHGVDRRSDIYSVGVVLYKLLTGELPFPGSNRMIREQVLYDEPRAPRRLNDRIPRDLETITLRCMAKEPARRYQTAATLAADLRRWLRGEPVLARPVGALSRLWRWSKRKPLLASLNATVVLLLFIVAVISTTAWFHIAAARNEAEERLIRQYVASGTRLMDGGELLMALPWFAEALRLEEGDSARESAHRIRLAAVLRSAPKLVQLWFHDAPVLYTEFSHDGRQVATACQDGTVRVWDAHTGELITPVFRHHDAVTRVTFSGDDRLVATASVDATARVWDVRTGNPVGSPLEHPGAVRDVAFSPDGKYVASASAEMARVWNVVTGQPVTEPLEHRDAVNRICFSPDGRSLLTCIGSAIRGRIGDALVWDIETAKLALPPLSHGDDVFEASYSPDGSKIVTASYDRSARVWDSRNGEPVVPQLPHGGSVTHASFSPDGRHLVSVSQGVARVWDASTGTLVIQPEESHTGPVLNATYGPDGHCVLSIALDRTVRVWNAETGQPVTSPLVHSGQVNHASFSPEGRLLLTASSDGTVRVWDLGTAGMGGAPLEHQGRVTHGSFSPDGCRAVTASEDCTAMIWDPLTGQPVTVPLNHRFPVAWALFSPDGQYVVTAESGRDPSLALIWDAATGSRVGRGLEHHDAVTRVTISPDSRRVLTSSLDGTARSWEVSSGKLLATFSHPREVLDVAFSPDGQRVATASADHTACIWNASTGTPLTVPMLHPGAVHQVVFSGDGRFLLTASSDRSARVWNTETGRLVAGPIKHGDSMQGDSISQPSFASFSPNGLRVVTASRDNARVWDAVSGAAIIPPLILKDGVTHASFSPNGRWVLTASSAGARAHEGEARLWDAITAEPITPSFKHRDGVNWASFSPDGNRILTASSDRIARVWSVPTDTRSSEDLQLIAQVLSSYRLEATHGFVPMRVADLLETWQVLRLRHPQEFTSSSGERIAWHQHEADDSAWHQQWFAAAWHLDRLIQSDPNRWHYWSRRGATRAEQGDWTGAVSDYARAIEMGADDEETLEHYAVLRLELGDVNEYQSTCQRLVDRTVRNANPVVARRAVATCVLAPAAIADQGQLLAAAKVMATYRYSDVYVSTLGAALYRAGHFDAALDHLGQALEIQGADAARDWLFSAMAHHRLGQHDEARRALERAVLRMDRDVPNDRAIDWDGRLGLRHLRQEAERLLSQQSSR